MYWDAVHEDPNALQYVPEKYQSGELCMLAIKQNINAIKYVINQTEELCLKVIDLYSTYICEDFITHIKNPTENICVKLLETKRDIHFMKYLKYV
jgi:hypothetical protein